MKSPIAWWRARKANRPRIVINKGQTSPIEPVELSTEQLHELARRQAELLDLLPASTHHVRIVAEPNEVVQLVIHAHATRQLLTILAPQLLAVLEGRSDGASRLACLWCGGILGADYKRRRPNGQRKPDRKFCSAECNHQHNERMRPTDSQGEAA